MNLKKLLRKQAEKDAQSLITEEDKKFIQQLIPKYVKCEKQQSEKELSENNCENR